MPRLWSQLMSFPDRCNRKVSPKGVDSKRDLRPKNWLNFPL